MKHTRRIPATGVLHQPATAKSAIGSTTRVSAKALARIQELWELPASGRPRNHSSEHDETLLTMTATTIRITTLGPFMVYLPTPRGLQIATWRDERTRLLLKCLLAASTYWLTRDQLIELLWPELDSAQGQDALRHALSRLRRTLEPERIAYDRSSYLASDRDSVWLVRNLEDERRLRIWVDRDHFERLGESALQHLRHMSDPQRLRLGQRLATKALQIYRDHFLPADQYADWTQATRSRCRRLWITLLWRMANVALMDHYLDDALVLLGQLVDTVPDDERAVAQLMRVQAACGQRGEALRTYHALSAYMASQLGAVPMEEIQRLADAIRAGATSSADLFDPTGGERQEG